MLFICTRSRARAALAGRARRVITLIAATALFGGALQVVASAPASAETPGTWGIGYFSHVDGTWHLRNDATTPGGSDYAFGFGPANGLPVTGDWNGDGTTGIGYFNPTDSTLHLRNDPTTTGSSNYAYGFGNSNIIPVSGSWTGAAKTGIGYFSKTDGTWHLRNDATTSGSSDYAFGFGNGNDIPVTGDWNGDGKTGIGVYDPSDGTLHLRNDATTSGASDYVYSFGVSNMALVSGNFDGIGGAGIGYYNKSDGTLHLRNDATSAGGSDYAYGFGATNTVPVSGNWNGNVPATTAAGLASQLLAKWGGNLTGNSGVYSDLTATSQGHTITNSDTCGNTISLDKDLLQVILQITTRYQLFLDNIVTGHGCDQYYHPMGLATDMGGLTDPVSGATTNFTSGSGSDNESLDRSFVVYLANILTGFSYNTGLGQSGCSGRTGIAMPPRVNYFSDTCTHQHLQMRY